MWWISCVRFYIFHLTCHHCKQKYWQRGWGTFLHCEHYPLAVKIVSVIQRLHTHVPTKRAPEHILFPERDGARLVNSTVCYARFARGYSSILFSVIPRLFMDFSFPPIWAFPRGWPPGLYPLAVVMLFASHKASYQIQIPMMDKSRRRGGRRRCHPSACCQVTSTCLDVWHDDVYLGSQLSHNGRPSLKVNLLYRHLECQPCILESARGPRAGVFEWESEWMNERESERGRE